MFPWGGRWPQSCCIRLAEGLLAFSECKRGVCLFVWTQLLLTSFPPVARWVEGQVGTFWDWSDWVSGARASSVAALGFHAEGEQWTANSLAWMFESSPWLCAKILFPVRCFLTSLSDGVFSWKTVAEAQKLRSVKPTQLWQPYHLFSSDICNDTSMHSLKSTKQKNNY